MNAPGYRAAAVWMPLLTAVLLSAALYSAAAGRSAAPSLKGQGKGGELPKAEDILDRYIRVTGGRTAYDALHNIVSKGTFRVARPPVRGIYTAYEAEPAKTRIILDFEGGEKAEQGTIGDIAWEYSNRYGARLISGKEKTVALREATFNSMFKWRGLYRKAACAGIETVGERNCYKIVLSPVEGPPLTQYFDGESGLLVRSFIILDGPAGPIRSENLYGDYRKDNAEVLFPHHLVQRIGNEEVEIRLESVRCNVNIAPLLFDLPTEVRALTRKSR